MKTNYIITKYTNREEIHVWDIMPGCVTQDTADTEIILKTEDATQARATIIDLQSSFKPYKRASDLFVITEFELCKYDYDEEGEIVDITSLEFSEFPKIKLVKTNNSGNKLEIIVDAGTEHYHRFYYDFDALWNDYDEIMAADYTPEQWAELDETKAQMAEQIQKECSCIYEDARDLVEDAFLAYEDVIMSSGQIAYEEY